VGDGEGAGISAAGWKAVRAAWALLGSGRTVGGQIDAPARRAFGLAERFELDRRDVPERAVQADGVEPRDPLHGRELKLGPGPPDAVGDQLGFVRIDERFRERVRVRLQLRLMALLGSELFE
jgi:hypothetical protein